MAKQLIFHRRGQLQAFRASRCPDRLHLLFHPLASTQGALPPSLQVVFFVVC
jgi:hypothetical protein